MNKSVRRLTRSHMHRYSPCTFQNLAHTPHRSVSHCARRRRIHSRRPNYANDILPVGHRVNTFRPYGQYSPVFLVAHQPAFHTCCNPGQSGCCTHCAPYSAPHRFHTNPPPVPDIVCSPGYTIPGPSAWCNQPRRPGNQRLNCRPQTKYH